MYHLQPILKLEIPSSDIYSNKRIHPDIKAQEWLRSNGYLDKKGKNYYIGLTIPPCVQCDVNIQVSNAINDGQISTRPTDGRIFKGWTPAIVTEETLDNAQKYIQHQRVVKNVFIALASDEYKNGVTLETRV